MKVKTAKAAVLTQSRQPLIVDEITLPDELGVGQVLVKILYSTICGAQINEIAAAKGPDKFLPHLLGHEASATVIETGLGVVNVKPGDTVVLHWRPSLGIQCQPPAYRWHGEKLNAGWVTTFNDYAVVSENRMTPIDLGYDLKVAPLLGCAVTTAAGVINNDAGVKIGESVVVFGGQDHSRDASGLGGADPLAAIQLRWIEQLFIFMPVAPLAVRERIHSKVDERGELVALPRDLAGRWMNLDGLGEDRFQRIAGRQANYIIRCPHRGAHRTSYDYENQHTSGLDHETIPTARKAEPGPL